MQNLLCSNKVINKVNIVCFLDNYNVFNKTSKEYKEIFKFVYVLTNQKPLFINYKFNLNKFFMSKVTLSSKNNINYFLSELFKNIIMFNSNKNLNNIKFYKFNKFFDFNIYINNNKLNFFLSKYNLKDRINFGNVNFIINIIFNSNVTNKYKLHYLIKKNFKILVK